jgi:hypothetical protein
MRFLPAFFMIIGLSGISVLARGACEDILSSIGKFMNSVEADFSAPEAYFRLILLLEPKLSSGFFEAVSRSEKPLNPLDGWINGVNQQETVALKKALHTVFANEDLASNWEAVKSRLGDLALRREKGRGARSTAKEETRPIYALIEIWNRSYAAVQPAPPVFTWLFNNRENTIITDNGKIYLVPDNLNSQHPRYLYDPYAGVNLAIEGLSAPGKLVVWHDPVSKKLLATVLNSCDRSSIVGVGAPTETQTEKIWRPKDAANYFANPDYHKTASFNGRLFSYGISKEEIPKLFIYELGDQEAVRLSAQSRANSRFI